MNKPTSTRTNDVSMPKGDVVCWTGSGPFAGISLRSIHSPTVLVVTDPTAPLTFEASVDGESWALIRDKDNEAVRVTKSGAYRMPVATLYLRPVCLGEVTIHTFISRGA